jgi:hypothetical protein
MLAMITSAALQGIDAEIVFVEVNANEAGEPKVILVGLPDAAVKESDDRVFSALSNSGFKPPRTRTTINLAPGNLRKEGPFYDLPIALGILAATKQLQTEQLGDTQMGNQGHATEGIRLVREWFELGLLGEVREVVAWGPAMGGHYFYRPATVPPAPGDAPPSLDWDLWLGPAEERPFAPMYQPEMWRGWWDFGSGMLGDWACHTLDAPFWALQLGAPERVEVRVSEVNPHLIPRWAVVTFHFPARGSLPPVKLTWTGAPTLWARPPASCPKASPSSASNTGRAIRIQGPRKSRRSPCSTRNGRCGWCAAGRRNGTSSG